MIEYLVRSQIKTLGRFWTGYVTDNLNTIRINRTTIQPYNRQCHSQTRIFETTGDLLAKSVQNQLQTLESQKTLKETLREHLGPLSQKYVGAILTGDRESDMDRMYGVYLDMNGMMFDNKWFNVDKADNIIIDGVRYIGTPGLYELIFKRSPMTSYVRRTISKSTRAYY